MPRHDPQDQELRPDDLDSGREVTARPSAHAPRRLEDEDDDRLVPTTNIGGAAPTPRGLDSGGDLPGPEDDLASLAEPEPPTPAEVEGLSVRPEADIAPTMGTDDPEP
jgi:hypothetical protein